MVTLGINFGHDASATLIKDGKILGSIEEEKLSRVKQDKGWPKFAVQQLLSEHGYQPSQVDFISFGSSYYNEFSRFETKYRFSKNPLHKSFEKGSRVWSFLTNNSNIRFGSRNKSTFEKELKKLGFIHSKIQFKNHHLAHAASAAYCSPVKPDLVITCDGHGDGESFNFYTFKNGTLETIHVNDYSVSVGAFYSAITKLLGFRPTRHEGKITGLAAFGKETDLVREMNSLFGFEGDHLTRFPGKDYQSKWEQLKRTKKLTLTRQINLQTSEGLIGQDYAKIFEILLSKIEVMCQGYTKEDIAYACQKVSEQIVLEQTKRIISKYFPGQKIYVALAGGVFANVRINQMIYEMQEVENIFIQPAMGDSGLSMGAAILTETENSPALKNSNSYIFENTYWGPDYGSQVSDFVGKIAEEAKVHKMTNPAFEIANLLADNKVVGFWHGSMEWGPRALGRRSMILNTFDKSVNDSVNSRLNRTEFMPFAPSVLDHLMTTYMPGYNSNCPAADYMTMTYDVAEEYHEVLQAVVHVDGTARPQAVKRATNPYYYDIISEFYKLTGCGAIVNTSFNAHEEPIVSTPEVAFKALKEDRIDVLILDEYRISMIEKSQN